jgi:hypothetical protein
MPLLSLKMMLRLKTTMTSFDLAGDTQGIERR